MGTETVLDAVDRDGGFANLVEAIVPCEEAMRSAFALELGGVDVSEQVGRSLHALLAIRLDVDDAGHAAELHAEARVAVLPQIAREVVAVENTRGIGKRDMVLNDACPRIEVDPETYEVHADGEHLTCEPMAVLPLAQRYFLF